MGFSNIKIYNGGIKDWKKSGYPLESASPLPVVPVNFIETETLYALLKQYDEQQCKDDNGLPLLTLLDFRNGNLVQSDHPPPQIATQCPVELFLLDDILEERNRAKIPRTGKVVIITETGNRDEFVIRYLSQYGFTSVIGLKFGMRGWLKQRYPIK